MMPILLKSGFFNSQSGDRKYDAEDMNSILSGVIKNGVLYSVGQRFGQAASDAESNGSIQIYSGKAWINGHWISNDATQTVALDAGPTSGYRWDVIYLKIDDDARTGSIDSQTGTPNSSKPIISTSNGVHVLPLCYVYRKPNVKPQNSDITNLVGTNACPYVTFGVQDGTDAQVAEILNRLDNLNRASFGIYVGTADPSAMASNLNVYDIYIQIQS